MEAEQSLADIFKEDGNECFKKKNYYKVLYNDGEDDGDLDVPDFLR